ncbi:hypothetical protein [Leuconostoc sp. UCMA20149]|uniref:hypothetical protein n=1 Tax=Leuconostoc sp. UCMA20149 TaxID=2583528 RepID=UPI0025B00787|nr:hypothetical protein [Leuconostoc sp. UCMA20149]MDN2450974.1 hypothetical protein [Leuconostoc sp. UCMA20149]
MKIVSLQSVGLGTYFSGNEDETTYSPTLYIVGDGIERVGYFDNGNEPKVTKIEFGDLYHGMEMPRQDDTYFVYTSDGHIRVLPADKYIAEWSE